MKKNYSLYALLLLSFFNTNTLKPAQAEEEPAQQASAEISGFYCGHCQKAFLKLTDLRSHENSEKITPSTEFYCSTCDYTTQYSSRLTTHVRTHTGERPFTCDICEKKFTQSSILRTHQRVHTQERPFQCTMCPKTFTQSSSLARHERIHISEKPFQCDICQKDFSQKSSLDTHKRIHTGEKPFKCDICKKDFTRKSTLERHKRSHTGERPFKCDICEKKFTQLSDLKVHNRSKGHTENADLLNGLTPPPYCPLTPLPSIHDQANPDAHSDQDSEYENENDENASESESDDDNAHPSKLPRFESPAPYPAPYNPELNKDNEDPELIALIENDLLGNQTAEEYIQNLTPTKFPSSIILSKELTLLGGVPAKSESAFDYQTDSDSDNDHDSKRFRATQAAPAPAPAPYKE
jgi:uncharacterized Zn-finger protein